jgi:hypothetical protein
MRARRKDAPASRLFESGLSETCATYGEAAQLVRPNIEITAYRSLAWRARKEPAKPKRPDNAVEVAYYVMKAEACEIA